MRLESKGAYYERSALGFGSNPLPLIPMSMVVMTSVYTMGLARCWRHVSHSLFGILYPLHESRKFTLWFHCPPLIDLIGISVYSTRPSTVFFAQRDPVLNLRLDNFPNHDSLVLVERAKHMTQGYDGKTTSKPSVEILHRKGLSHSIFVALGPFFRLLFAEEKSRRYHQSSPILSRSFTWMTEMNNTAACHSHEIGYLSAFRL